MKNLILLITVAAVISGCADWKQDPLDGKNPVLNKGQGEPTEQETQNPTPTDAIRILTADFVRFKELQAGELAITVRNFLPGFATALSIDNLADFPGATFDAATGKFKWTPARGLLTPAEIEKFSKLKVRVYATRPGEPTVVAEKEVQVVLNRQFNVPKITAITKSVPATREGEIFNVTVDVEDLDADPVDAKTWPMLQIMPTANRKTLSGFMVLNSYRFVSVGKYQAVFRVDLTGSDITDSSDTFFFDINVVTRYLMASDRQTQSIKVLTQFSEIATTWGALLEETVGADIKYQFLVYDPKSELSISFEGIKEEITGSITTCTNLNRSVLSCKFNFNSAAITAPTVLNFKLTTRAKNLDTTDAQQVVKDHTLTINLKR